MYFEYFSHDSTTIEERSKTALLVNVLFKTAINLPLAGRSVLKFILNTPPLFSHQPKEAFHKLVLVKELLTKR